MTDDVRDIDSAAAEAEADPEPDEALTGEPTHETDEADAEEETDEADEDTEEDADETDEAEEDADEADSPAARRRLSVPPRVRRIGAVVLVVLLLGSCGVATWLYFKQYRPDQQTDADAARSVARAASDGTTALLSYSVDTLDRDFAAAKSHLAGDFLSYYDQFSKQTVAPMAKQKSMTTTAKVTGAAVSELHPDSAVVLVFVDQVTTAKDNPNPAVAVTSVLVRMSRVGGDWRITKFSPV